MKVSQRLYEKALPIWESYFTHPFIQGMADGTHFPRLQKEVFDWEDPEERDAFLESERPRTVIALSRLGASRAIASGAYYFAEDRAF